VTRVSEPSTSRSASPRHRFAPGQEEEARAFLRRPTEFESYRVLANRFALWMMFLSAPLGVGMYFLLAVGTSPSDTESRWIYLVGSSCLALGLLGLSGFKLIQYGRFVLDPERGEIRTNEESISFAKVRNPEVRTVDSEYVDTEFVRRQGYSWGIEYSRGAVLLSQSSFSRRKLEHIAELLGAMAAEYHEKEAVRRWLEERRLAQNDSPPDASGSPPRTTE
jgi:hypothetical protein